MSENEALARVGAQLRQLRTSQDVEGQVLARELGWSGAKLSRIEQGKIRVSVSDLAAALDALGAREEVRAELLATTAAGSLGAWMVRSGGPARRQAEVGYLEQRVSALHEYHPLLVPGLMQSASYTRAMAEASGFDAPRVVAARVARQGLLAVEGAPRFRALLDERAFARWAGDRAVMIDQITHLLGRMQLPNVEAQLLPSGPNAQTLALGAFVLYEFTETSPVVLLEHHAVDVFLATDEDVQQYRRMFAELSAESLSPAETAVWLKGRRDELIQENENG